MKKHTQAYKDMMLQQSKELSREDLHIELEKLRDELDSYEIDKYRLEHEISMLNSEIGAVVSKINSIS